MLKFLSSMLRTSKLHPFSLGNLMITRVTSVEWTWLGLEWPATPDIFGLLFQEFLRIFVFVFEITRHSFIPSTLLKLVVYICLNSHHLCFRTHLIIQQLYAICHINEKTTPR